MSDSFPTHDEFTEDALKDIIARIDGLESAVLRIERGVFYLVSIKCESNIRADCIMHANEERRGRRC